LIHFYKRNFTYDFIKMLERPGDLIPVNENAITIPWTKRRSQVNGHDYNMIFKCLV